jgi:hypothetical protein
MALYDGYPVIRLEGDRAAASNLIPQAKLLLYKVQQICKSSGASTYAMSERVSDNAYIYVLQSGAQSVLVCTVYSAAEEIAVVGEQIGYPDFYSGCIYEGSAIKEYTEKDANGYDVTYEAMASFCPTYDCAMYFAPPPPPPPAPQTRTPVLHKQKNKRLVLRSDTTAFPETGSAPDGLFARGQTRFLKPSMWSGTMSKVVSIIAGIGAISKYKLLNGASGWTPPAAVGQIHYDYKWHRTHGVFLGESEPDGNGNTHVEPWLIEISMSRGVLAMPLEVLPSTLGHTASGKRWKTHIDKYYGTVGTEVIDLINGMPSGRGFPTNEALEAQIEAGNILRLLQPSELNDFYSGGVPFSTAHGWCFNNKGNEAHNVRWKFGDLVRESAHFQIAINIGPIKKKREKDEPIAVGTAIMTKQSEGQYCYGGGKLSCLPFKVWEPIVNEGYGGLVSAEGEDRNGKGQATTKVYGDAPVFVCFQNDEIKVVRFWYDGREQEYILEKPEGAKEEYPWSSLGCLPMANIAIEWDERVGYPIAQPAMYTNDIDERVLFMPQDVNKFLGFAYLDDGEGAKRNEGDPVCSDTLENIAWGCCGMQRWYSSYYQTITTFDKRVMTGVVVPAYCRNAFFYSKGEYQSGTQKQQFYTVHGQFSQQGETYYRAGPADNGLYPYHVPPNIPDKLKCFPQCKKKPCRNELERKYFDYVGRSTCGIPHDDPLFARYGCENNVGPPLGGSCTVASPGGGWLTATYVDDDRVPPMDEDHPLSGWVAAFFEPEETDGKLTFYHQDGKVEDLPQTWYDSEMIRSKSPDPDDGTYHHWYATYAVFGKSGTTFYDNLLERGGQPAMSGVVPGSTEETVDEIVPFIGYNDVEER